MLKTHCFRLTPGQDLKMQLIEFCKSRDIKAAALLSGVGSLTEVRLRLSDSAAGTSFVGPFEIVSLIGTLSSEAAHLHIAISDNAGKTIGGHLLDRCLIHTTAEIVLLEIPAIEFQRTHDDTTGYKELTIKAR